MSLAAVSTLWWIPLGVAAAAIGPLYLAGQAVAQEFQALSKTIAATRELRAQVSEVRRAVDSLVDR
jgi:hypothetical protein